MPALTASCWHVDLQPEHGQQDLQSLADMQRANLLESCMKAFTCIAYGVPPTDMSCPSSHVVCQG